MFKDIKLKIKSLEEFIESQEERLSTLEEDYNDYFEWKKMRDANEEAAAKMGHFYITAEDSALLERLIQECNKDQDLAVLLTTAQGTTLTLRSHPQPKAASNTINYGKFAEEEE